MQAMYLFRIQQLFHLQQEWYQLFKVKIDSAEKQVAMQKFLEKMTSQIIY